MNLILKALNDISIVFRNTVSMFLPVKDTNSSTQTSVTQTAPDKHSYPHNHITTSTATNAKNSYFIYTKDSYSKSYPYDQKKESPYSSVKIKKNPNEIWNTKTDIAVQQLKRAVANKGINPKFHDKLMKKHRKEWPELWTAIDAVIKNSK